MATFGRACLILALAVALYGIGAVDLRRARRGRRDWVGVRPPRGLRAGGC